MLRRHSRRIAVTAVLAAAFAVAIPTLALSSLRSPSPVVAAAAAAKKEGPSVKLQPQTIGLVNVVRASEAAQRLEKGARDAAKGLGWKLIAIDAAGDPTKSEAAFVSLINQHVSAIVDLSNATAAITQGLAMARAAKIPVINIGGHQDPSPNIEAQYYGDPFALTAALDKYMFAHLPKHAKIAIFTSRILLDERERDAQLAKDAAKAGATIVFTHAVDLANLNGDTQAAAHAALLAHPDLNAFWGDIDSEMPVVALVLKAAGKCATIGNYNYYDDLVNLNALKSGCATAVTSSPVEADGWAAIDQFAEFFARHKSITSFPPTWTQLQSTIYGVDIRTGNAIVITDKSSLPAAGQHVRPQFDFAAFFKAKWKNEYGIG